jgi:aldose 1-epimerase
MHYRLENGTLEVGTAVTNLGSEDLPLAIGFHPYYRVFDAPRDEWSLTIPARTQMVLDDKNLPTGERRPNPVAPNSALRTLKLDDVFVDLVRDGNGWAGFELKGKSQKVTVAMGPAFRAGVVFTPMDGRETVAIEPMTAVTNGFNLAQRGLYPELQTVAPGATWWERFRITPEGF